MKTYFSVLYFNNGNKERVNVSLIMFNDIKHIVEINESKMNFVKLFKPKSFELGNYIDNYG